MISYLLDGGVEHRDSAGFRDQLGPGDAQWMDTPERIVQAKRDFLGGRMGRLDGVPD
ncbi:MAG: pirin family protein [Lautropia sp.]